MSVDFYKEFGDLGYLANYSNHGFYKNGIYYRTAEHYYQSAKFDNLEVKNKIINALTPKEASNIGRDRKNIRKDGFNKIKNDVMYEAVYQKFSQNKDIRSRLIETRNYEIREMTVKESYWGVGPNLDGYNYSGKILMSVRDRVKKELLDKVISDCYDKKVYIISNNTDMDSLISCYIIFKILKSMGLDVVFAVRDNNSYNKELYGELFAVNCEIINDYQSKYFILVNCNNLNGISLENVIFAIDIHDITFEVSELIDMKYISCALLIYDLFKDKYKFDSSLNALIALTVLSNINYDVDKLNFEDRKLFNELVVSFKEFKS